MRQVVFINKKLEGSRKEHSLVYYNLVSTLKYPDPNPDPDPHVFWPPGSGSTSQRYESGSGSGSDPDPSIIMKK